MPENKVALHVRGTGIDTPHFQEVFFPLNNYILSEYIRISNILTREINRKTAALQNYILLVPYNVCKVH